VGTAVSRQQCLLSSEQLMCFIYILFIRSVSAFVSLSDDCTRLHGAYITYGNPLSKNSSTASAKIIDKSSAMINIDNVIAVSISSFVPRQ